MVALVVGTSCDLNQLDNPSKLSPTQADPDLLLNQVQVFTADFFYNVSDYGMQMTRMIHFYGPNFENGFTPLSFDYIWTTAYANVLVNAQALQPLATTNQLYMHSGMAKVLSAYVAMTLVDFFGDVPYSEALKATNLNPKADGGAAIYADAIAKLDEAIADFGQNEPKKPYDLFYGGNKTKWITLAKTLKLRAYMNMRLVDPSVNAKIQALVSANDLIDTDAENFVFQYSKNIANPDARHPYFIGNYLSGAGTFHNNWLMYNMVYDKATVAGGATAAVTEPVDPRTRYYFFRQNAQVTYDINLISCLPRPRPASYLYNPKWPFCTLKNSFDGSDLGYWGRDFGDATGVNPDTGARTNWGVYPIGGKFDDLSLKADPDYAGDEDHHQYMDASVPLTHTPDDHVDPVPNGPGDGLAGAGIAPMWMSSFTYFLLAEARNVGVISTGPTDAALLATAIDKSITSVMNFGAAATGGASNVPTPAIIANYKSIVATRMTNAAASASTRLDIIMREYWIAAFGNGVEPYNFYRRTAMPMLMQPPLSASPGLYYRSFTYPSVYVTRNSNATQKTSDAVKVFWDNNPASKLPSAAGADPGYIY